MEFSPRSFLEELDTDFSKEATDLTEMESTKKKGKSRISLRRWRKINLVRSLVIVLPN